MKTKSIAARVSMEYYGEILADMKKKGIPSIADWIKFKLAEIDNQSSKNINPAYEKKIIELKEKIIELKEKIKGYEDYLESDYDNKKRLEKENTELKEINEKWEELSKREMNSQNDLFGKYESEISALEGTISSYENDIKGMNIQLKDKDRKNTGLQRIINLNLNKDSKPVVAPVDIDKYKNTIVKLRESNAAKTKENISLKKKMERREEYDKEKDETIDRYYTQIVDLKNQLRIKRG